MTIYTCAICTQTFKSASALGNHTNKKHNISAKDYYIKYIDSRSTCVDCNSELHFHGMNEGFRQRCKSCAKRHDWKLLDISEQEKRVGIMRSVAPKNPGRKLGSRNTVSTKGKRPAVMDPHWLHTEEARKKRKETWANKSADEIQEMLNKQAQTAIDNGRSSRVRTYQGRFTPSNKEKYVGDVNNIVYRSGWELQVMKWCDSNSAVEKWGSEEIVIGYYSDVDKRPHRYFVDFYIKYTSGRTQLIEVKPFRETQTPKKQGKSRATQLREATTYIVNQNKWNAAEKYAKDNGYTFMIWTEKELTKMGILPKQSEKQLKPLKPLKPFRKKKKK